MKFFLTSLLLFISFYGSLMAENQNPQNKTSDSLSFQGGIFLPQGHYKNLLENGWQISGNYNLFLFDSLFLSPQIHFIETQSKFSHQSNSFIMPGIGLNYQLPITNEFQFVIKVAAGPYFLKAASGEWINNFYGMAGLGLNYHLTDQMAIGIHTSLPYLNDSEKNIYGLSLGFNLNYFFEVNGSQKNKNPLSKSIQFEDIYSSSYTKYFQKPIGIIKLKNNTQEIMEEIQVSLLTKNFMAEKTTSKQSIPVLYPGKEIQLPIYAYFEKKMKYLESDTETLGIIEVVYLIQKMKYKTQYHEKLKIYSKNSLKWENPERFGTFITSSDPAIVEFVRNILSLPLKTPLFDKTILSALKVFTAMQKFPLAYLPSPKSSSKVFQEGIYQTDFIQYPRELLRSKSGNCADLAAFFLSSLESVGIATAFITLPGHIIPLIEAPENLNQMILKIQGKKWIPIEITLLNQGFTESWKNAYHQLKNNSLSQFKTSLEATYKFPPFSFDTPESFDPNLNLNIWNETLNQEIKEIQKLMDSN